MWLNQADSNGGFGGLLRLPPGLVDYMVEVILNTVPGEDVLEASLADLIIDLLGKYALQVCLLFFCKIMCQFQRSHKCKKVFFALLGSARLKAVGEIDPI